MEMKGLSRWLLLSFSLLCSAEAFAIGRFPSSSLQTGYTLDSRSILNCICIDCKWVTSCKAYHFVESKHEQPHMTEDPTFEPQDGSPTIHVNIRTTRTDEQQETQRRMWKEHAAETAKAEAQQKQQQEQSGESSENMENTPLHGETVYDLAPVTTYEYDVVACEDFVEDKGCWVRNMPEEIRIANPDFVPT